MKLRCQDCGAEHAGILSAMRHQCEALMETAFDETRTQVEARFMELVEDYRLGLVDRTEFKRQTSRLRKAWSRLKEVKT